MKWTNAKDSRPPQGVGPVLIRTECGLLRVSEWVESGGFGYWGDIPDGLTVAEWAAIPGITVE